MSQACDSVESGCLIGFVAFVLTLFVPATYVAMHRRDMVAPPDAELLEYVGRNWTEEPGFTKATAIGLVSGVAAAGFGHISRAFRRRWGRPKKLTKWSSGPASLPDDLNN